MDTMPKSERVADCRSRDRDTICSNNIPVIIIDIFNLHAVITMGTDLGTCKTNETIFNTAGIAH